MRETFISEIYLECIYNIYALLFARIYYLPLYIILFGIFWYLDI